MVECGCLQQISERLTDFDKALLLFLSDNPRICRERLIIGHRINRYHCDIALNRLQIAGLVEIRKNGRNLEYDLSESGRWILNQKEEKGS